MELFMTPTATAFADIVLPSAMFPERNSVKWFGWDRLPTLNKALEPPGECKSNVEINRLVGKRLNPEAWPWENEEECWDAFLAPTGMTFQDVRILNEYQDQDLRQLSTRANGSLQFLCGKKKER